MTDARIPLLLALATPLLLLLHLQGLIGFHAGAYGQLLCLFIHATGCALAAIAMTRLSSTRLHLALALNLFFIFLNLS